MENETPGWQGKIDKIRKVKIDRRKLARHAKKVEKVTQRHAHRFVLKRMENVRLVYREISIWLLIVSVMIAGLGVHLVWSQKGFVASGRESGGLYVEGVIGPVNTLNPIFISSSADAALSSLMFSSLYDYDAGGVLRQDVAAGMTIDAAGKVYSVTVRGDVKWHDGEKLTAEDVVFTIATIKNEAVRSPLRSNWTDVDVKQTDSRTIEFTLPAAYAAFPHALTFPILPKHLLKDVSPASLRESTFSKSPVGSGAFSFRRFQVADTLSKQEVIHLIANESYHQGAPKISRFEVHVFDDESELLLAVKSGEVSGANDLSPAHVSEVGNKYKVASVPLSSGVYLIFNTTNAIFNNKDVRKALQVGTDTVALRKKLGGGVLPLDLPVLPRQLSGDDIPSAPNVDLVKAVSMLDTAGWRLESGIRKKDGQPMSITLTTSSSGKYEKVASLLADQWRSLGIDVKIKTIDSAAASFVQDTLQGRNFDVLLYELVIGADPDVYAYWHSSQTGQAGYNFANYTNKAADASLASARSTLDASLRNAKYKAFSAQWLDDAPAIALYQSVVEYASSKNAQTVNPSMQLVTSSDRYSNVLYWTVSGRDVYKTP